MAVPIGAASKPAEPRRRTQRASDLRGRALHLVGTELVTLDGNRADIAATLHPTHLHRLDDPGAPLHIGAEVEAEAIRTPETWMLLSERDASAVDLRLSAVRATW